ncbi:TPA: hypothetical protein ACIVAP_000805, partial [Salmonella enterica subsp. enterica serovar Java]
NGISRFIRYEDPGLFDSSVIITQASLLCLSFIFNVNIHSTPLKNKKKWLTVELILIPEPLN